MAKKQLFPDEPKSQETVNPLLQVASNQLTPEMFGDPTAPLIGERPSRLMGDLPLALPQQNPDPYGIGAAQSKLAEFDRPQKPDLFRALLTVGQGINFMDPGQFQQIQTRKLGEEYAQKQDQRKALLEGVNRALALQQQDKENMRADSQEGRAAGLYPLAKRAAEAEARAAETKLTAPERKVYPPGSLIVVTSPDGKEISRETVPFKEATASPEYEWVVRNGQPLQIQKGTSQVGDRPYEKPTQGPQPDYEWVLRGGQPVQIQKGTAKPGDTPYDPVAARTPAKEVQSAYSRERSIRTLQSVKELKAKVSNATVGAGSLMSSVPGSAALNFKSELETLKANIAFNELQAMRDASKTGGALGPVSDKEAQLLESSLGALDIRQSPQNFAAQLDKIEQGIMRWQQAVEAQSGGGSKPGRFNPATGKVEY